MGELTMGRVMGYVVGFFLLLCGISWIAEGNDFFLYKFFAPKQEAVRRQVFEQSKAYNDGMAQELDNMRFEYLRAKPEQQDALASIILHRVAAYDVSKLPPDLQSFIEKLRQKDDLK